MQSLVTGTEPTWYDENRDLLGAYEEHYQHVHSIVPDNKSKCSQTDVQNVQIDENGLPEHL